MVIKEINSVCFVGAGTIGCANAMVAGLAGYRVSVYDNSPDNLALVPQRLAAIGTYVVMQGFCPQAAVDHVIAQLVLTDNLARATKAVELVSESVFENLEIKRQVHSQLDALCPPETIITTNTSSLLVSQIEDVVSATRAKLFAALHSHLGSTLIDIVPGPRTDPATLEILERYVISLDAVPLVLKKENPGYVVNAMLGPIMTAAMLMLQRRLGSIEDIDRAWMKHQGLPIGPFGLLDLFGINLIYGSWQQPRPAADYAANKAEIMALLMPYIKRQELGRLTGKGFYTYPDAAFEHCDFLKQATDAGPYPHYGVLRTVLVHNAILLAIKEIAAPTVIDRAWITATGAQRGPFEILDELGAEQYAKHLATHRRDGWVNDDPNAVDAYLQRCDCPHAIPKKIETP